MNKGELKVILSLILYSILAFGVVLASDSPDQGANDLELKKSRPIQILNQSKSIELKAIEYMVDGGSKNWEFCNEKGAVFFVIPITGLDFKLPIAINLCVKNKLSGRLEDPITLRPNSSAEERLLTLLKQHRGTLAVDDPDRLIKIERLNFLIKQITDRTTITLTRRLIMKPGDYRESYPLK